MTLDGEFKKCEWFRSGWGERLWDALALVVPSLAKAHNVALQVLSQLLQQVRPIHPAVHHLHRHTYRFLNRSIKGTSACQELTDGRKLHLP